MKQQSEGKERTNEMVEGLPEAVVGAFVSLLTRSFQDDSVGDGGVLENEKLVPLLDMLQHSDIPNLSHYTKNDPNELDYGTVVVMARTNLAAGEELLNQYRPELDESMPHHRFFTRFGFIPGVQEPIVSLLREKSPIFFAQTAEI
jgi:hypothetical protein